MIQKGHPRRDNYQSYLLRLWRDGEGGQWRASVEDTASGQKQLFASIALLVEFLNGRCRQPSEPGPHKSAPGQA